MSRFTTFLAAALLSCGLVLAADNVVSAQHHGGGGHHSGGGYRGGGGHYSGSGGRYYGGYHSGYHDGYHHNNGFWYGSGLFLGGYPYYGSYWGGYPSYYDGGSYYYPETVIEPSYSESYYESPAPMPYSEEQVLGNNPVTSIRVIKPAANAAIWMDGRRSDSSTDTHIFEFSDEPAGKMVTHTVKVGWMRDGKPVTEERKVQVGGGQSMVVDFTRPAAKK
jgi:uncharacterized protein (TIGR03000 family)